MRSILFRGHRRRWLLREGFTPNSSVVTDRNGTYSFHDLLAQTDAVYKLLQLKGVSKGDRVAVVVPMSLDFLAVTIAAWSLRAVVVPISAAAPPGDKAHIIFDASSRVAIGPGNVVADSVGTAAPLYVGAPRPSGAATDGTMSLLEAFRSRLPSHDDDTPAFLMYPSLSSVSPLPPGSEAFAWSAHTRTGTPLPAPAACSPNPPPSAEDQLPSSAGGPSHADARAALAARISSHGDSIAAANGPHARATTRRRGAASPTEALLATEASASTHAATDRAKGVVITHAAVAAATAAAAEVLFGAMAATPTPAVAPRMPDDGAHAAPHSPASESPASSSSHAPGAASASPAVLPSPNNTPPTLRVPRGVSITAPAHGPTYPAVLCDILAPFYAGVRVAVRPHVTATALLDFLAGASAAFAHERDADVDGESTHATTSNASAPRRAPRTLRLTPLLLQDILLAIDRADAAGRAVPEAADVARRWRHDALGFVRTVVAAPDPLPLPLVRRLRAVAPHVDVINVLARAECGLVAHTTVAAAAATAPRAAASGTASPATDPNGSASAAAPPSPSPLAAPLTLPVYSAPAGLAFAVAGASDAAGTAAFARCVTARAVPLSTFFHPFVLSVSPADQVGLGEAAAAAAAAVAADAAATAATPTAPASLAASPPAPTASRTQRFLAALEVSGPTVAEGLWDRREDAAMAYTDDGFLRSNLTVRVEAVRVGAHEDVDAAGRAASSALITAADGTVWRAVSCDYVGVLGRDVIAMRDGALLCTALIESLVAAHSGVMDVAVIPVERGGVRVPVAVVVPTPEATVTRGAWAPHRALPESAGAPVVGSGAGTDGHGEVPRPLPLRRRLADKADVDDDSSAASVAAGLSARRTATSAASDRPGAPERSRRRLAESAAQEPAAALGFAGEDDRPHDSVGSESADPTTPQVSHADPSVARTARDGTPAAPTAPPRSPHHRPSFRRHVLTSRTATRPTSAGAALLAHVRDAGGMAPSSVMFIGSLPRDGEGNVMRTQLRTLFEPKRSDAAYKLERASALSDPLESTKYRRGYSGLDMEVATDHSVGMFMDSVRSAVTDTSRGADMWGANDDLILQGAFESVTQRQRRDSTHYLGNVSPVAPGIKG